MMDSNLLWAKSKRDDEREIPSMLLAGHLADVYHAAERCLMQRPPINSRPLD